MKQLKRSVNVNKLYNFISDFTSRYLPNKVKQRRSKNYGSPRPLSRPCRGWFTLCSFLMKEQRNRTMRKSPRKRDHWDWLTGAFSVETAWERSLKRNKSSDWNGMRAVTETEWEQSLKRHERRKLDWSQGRFLLKRDESRHMDSL